MQIDVDFPGGVRVDAHFGRFTVHTDPLLRAVSRRDNRLAHVLDTHHHADFVTGVPGGWRPVVRV